MLLRGDWKGTGKPCAVGIEAGHITDVRGDVEVAPNAYLAPGFIDVQVNGYAGNDYSSPALDTAQIRAITERLLRAGATRHVPTIVTNSQERIVSNLKTIADAVSGDPFLRAAIPAVHVEGPFISEEDGPRGAHDPKHVRDPSVEEVQEWVDASGALLKVVTIAPERPGADRFIRAAIDLGLVVSIGHTAASPEAIRQAVEAGARMSTHLGNGSHGTIPRLRNYLWEQLAADQLSASLIADGFHLPPSVMKVFSRAKGLERIVLVSDAGPMAGLAPGRHYWGDIEVEVHEDGHLGLAGTQFLAGAGHLLDRAVAQFAKATGHAIADILPLVTTNPERLMGVQNTGANDLPRVGDAADLIQFTWQPGADAIDVHAVALEGEVWTTEHSSKESGR